MCSEDVVEVDENYAGIEGRGDLAKEVVLVEVCWIWEGGIHYGCKEGPWEAFQFGLG